MFDSEPRPIFAYEWPSLAGMRPRHKPNASFQFTFSLAIYSRCALPLAQLELRNATSVYVDNEIAGRIGINPRND